MSILWKPNGSLNVAANPADLPETRSEQGMMSMALTTCINLDTTLDGLTRTRPGSKTVSNAILDEVPSFQHVRSGVRYAFSETTIYRNELQIATFLNPGNFQWSAVSYNSFGSLDEEVFALNGAERKRINNADVHEWGIAAPTVDPVVAVGAGTGLTGTYRARYTYVRKSAGGTILCESNPSAVSASQALTNQSLSVTADGPSDPQVTHIRFYRTLAGDNNYYVDQDIAVGTTAIDSTTTDANLAGLLETDHDRPPVGGIVIGPAYGGYIFIAVGSTVYWCKPRQAEYWPRLNFCEVAAPDEPVTAMSIHDGQLYVATAQRIFWIQGTFGGSFSPVAFESKAGAANSQCFVGIKGVGLFHLDSDGLYLYTSGTDTKISEGAFEPLFRARSVGGMPFIAVNSNCWLAKHENKLILHYGTGSALLFNTDRGRWFAYQYPVRLYAPAYDAQNARFLVYTSTRRATVIEDYTSQDDAGEPITWTAKSKAFFLPTLRHFPAWVKYDVVGEAEATLLLDDAVHQVHPSIGGRSPRRRLVQLGNGLRCAVELSGSGPCELYAIEVE